MKAPSGLAGKSTLVTGGSRGIGRAIVELFAGEEGARVTFFYREQLDDRAANAAVPPVTSIDLPASPAGAFSVCPPRLRFIRKSRSRRRRRACGR